MNRYMTPELIVAAADAAVGDLGDQAIDRVMQKQLAWLLPLPDLLHEVAEIAVQVTLAACHEAAPEWTARVHRGRRLPLNEADAVRGAAIAAAERNVCERVAARRPMPEVGDD